jgi:subtilisin family serine protease
LGKIALDLLQQLETAPNAQIEYWVVLRDQVDTSNDIPVSRWAEKGWYVYNKLTEHAARTQPPVKAQLDALRKAGHVSQMESFWIINCFIITGDLAAAQSLAMLDAVGTIHLPPQATILDAPAALSPAAQDVLAAARPIAAPLLVQHNINEVRAWALGFTGAGIVVSSMDTGVRWTHEAVSARYRGNAAPPDPNIHDYNWYDGYLLSTTPIDQNGHGSLDDSAHLPAKQLQFDRDHPRLPVDAGSHPRGRHPQPAARSAPPGFQQ